MMKRILSLRKIFSNNDLEDIKMRLSENSSVAMIGEKFTSPPFRKVINVQKIGKTEDVNLMFTISYEFSDRLEINTKGGENRDRTII